MRITVQRDALANMLKAAKGFIKKSLRDSIENAILVQATDLGLSISATDLEISFTQLIPGFAEVQGSCIVDGKRFSSLINKMSKRAPEILLEFEEEALAVHCRTSRVALEARDGDEYPAQAQSKGGSLIDAALLKEAMEKALPASSTDETRPVLNSVMISSEALVSTDGHRLHVASGIPNLEGLLVPRAGVLNLIKLLDPEVQVSLELSQNQLLLSQHSWVAALRLVEGRFPDWKRVLPTDSCVHIKVNREDFISALSLCGIVHSDIVLSVSDTIMLLESEDEKNNAQESLVVSQEKEPMDFKIKLNGAYLSEALQVAGGDSVILRLNSSELPLVIEGENGSEFVIMPMVL